jgi:hypothetical protein
LTWGDNQIHRSQEEEYPNLTPTALKSAQQTRAVLQNPSK